ncbi:composite domain of metallo-dependent hydrolase [Fomitiporia mediterranea MF3/22]|uniref:composite domain of metallo-dependent hydrolase n=1 Tax=Fomitiporia mediterranea (strain MF3/22) TaxID=694068 RepID=UPI0004408C4F|nr:composite domain of metallo-dependent hydrolase [Fomitiporia mediterranea MF3/22]EJD04405.1 composite domain of metallo-dependent hydrolase [Fomitiporia mediterranea MF3/22]
MQFIHGGRRRVVKLPPDAEFIRARCENLKIPPGPPRTFHFRTSSERFVPGTKATLVKNATIWTGNVDGKEVVKGDVLLDKGLIKAVGSGIDITDLDEVVTIDAEGGWVTPGIVDLHSHLGVNSVPKLSGAGDGNSRKGIAQPWLRSLDGLNTRDDAYRLSISGGVTTALVLPGSANDIGGQAFTMKLRPTKERTPTSMLLEPPFTLNSTDMIDMSSPPRWRQMKHACGENPRRVYGNSRMDNIWAFREIYDKARQIKEQQDAYCSKALSNDWDDLGSFPEELQYEAIVDTLRGRVKMQVHCYETVDLDDIVRLTNEFKFPIAAFHHAHETYLAPDLLKQAYGNTPASAMFATNARYKRESYRGSEFAARILADNGLPVVMKSDHPVLNSRYLLYEAQQAHYYGLPDNLAIASVTSTPARVMGMSHRIGFIKNGYDADVVLWDSHPLALGATPRQVFIDGIAQFGDTYAPPELKSEDFQKSPETPGFDKEVEETLKYDGLPPLEPQRSIAGIVVFTNITSITVRGTQGGSPVLRTFELDVDTQRGVLVSCAGKVDCVGTWSECSHFLEQRDAVEINLKGGAISPGLISFGSALGLEEIQGEVSTKDGTVFDPLDKDIPNILGDGPLIHAADGLQFATRNAYLAYRAGVTIGVTSPLHNGILSGLSTAFSLGTAHKLEKGALLQEVAAVHVTVGHSVGSGSVSTQVAALRRLLLEPGSGEAGKWFKAVAIGKMTLVVNAESADVIATLLSLKKEVEESTGERMKLTIAGASEAHLLASELAKADIGVIVVPSRPFPETWEKRRILPGPPITKDSAISLLLAHNVTVGIGIEEPWSARNTRFDIAWAALEAPSEISRTQALALASTNLEKLLGLDINDNSNNIDADLVATESGDLFDFEGKVVGVINPRKGVVDLFGL